MELESATIEEQAQTVETAVEKAGGRKALIQQFGTITIELSAPFSWCDKTYTKINLDFNSLTGVDMEAIDDEIGPRLSASPSNSRLYQRILAAKAAHIPSDAIENMPAADYNAITNAAYRFLIVSG